ncbi:spermidine synthase [Halocatena halophila]|uniref:spermidine synthase n=1 Tax=Halocatena halophila TaxID=2814576 RepID=UPI002ED5FF6A
MLSHPRFRTTAVLFVTFIVSFCSFAYEFVYSELLTVMYGGTVTQYVITIGLYFFSLGVGAAFSDDLAPDVPTNLFRTELYLAIVAPVGFGVIVAINSVALPAWIPTLVIWVVARLPVIMVGWLSGFELPLLTRLVGTEPEQPSLPGVIRRPIALCSSLLHRLLRAFWNTDRSQAPRSGLSVVLALDYVGGLAGAVVYARVLYPTFGLVTTILLLALINALAALVLFCLYSVRWGSASTSSRSFSSEPRVLVVVCLLVCSLLASGVVAHDTVDRSVTELYLEQQIESEHPPGSVEAEITDQWTTPYQHVVRYNRTWTGTGSNPYFEGKSEPCLRLDMAVQLCESWVETYHDGLVSVPLSQYERSPETDVLLIGGGDWIAVDELRQYNVSVDQVDLDAKFMNRTASDPFYRQYHNDATEYERLNTTVADGYTYLTNTETKYDLILLDIPGATDDDLLGLYSSEFYRLLAAHLTPNGVVGTWGYARSSYPEHFKAYTNTLHASGFSQYLTYWSRADLNGDGKSERVEQFYLLAPSDREWRATNRTTQLTHSPNRSLAWEPIPRFSGVRSNSLFHPNYDILIST